jgi:hypothetical protein
MYERIIVVSMEGWLLQVYCIRMPATARATAIQFVALPIKYFFAFFPTFFSGMFQHTRSSFIIIELTMILYL